MAPSLQEQAANQSRRHRTDSAVSAVRVGFMAYDIFLCIAFLLASPFSREAHLDNQITGRR